MDSKIKIYRKDIKFSRQCVHVCMRVVRTTCELRRKSNIKGPVVIDVMPLKKNRIERKIFTILVMY